MVSPRCENFKISCVGKHPPASTARNHSAYFLLSPSSAMDWKDGGMGFYAGGRRVGEWKVSLGLVRTETEGHVHNTT